MTTLKIENLFVRYHKAIAANDVSLDFPPGKISAIVGPNGAGKTSIILGICGAVGASGKVILEGQDISRLSATDRARRGIAIAPQGRQIFPRLTVEENLQVIADAMGFPPQSVEQGLNRFPILVERRDRLAGILSGGEQQMLVVSRALLGAPRVLLLDEMNSTGLAPMVIKYLMDEIRGLADRGLAVVLAEPSIGAVRRYIDRGYVLIRGRVVGECDGGDRLDDLYRATIGIAAKAELAPDEVGVVS